MITVGSSVIWTNQGNCGPFYNNDHLGKIGIVKDWCPGSGGNVEFFINGVSTWWFTNEHDVSSLNSSGGMINPVVNVDTSQIGYTISDSINRLETALISKKDGVLYSVSFNMNLYFEVINSKEVVFNKKIYLELEKKDENDYSFPEGTIVKGIATGQYNSSGRVVFLVRDTNGNESVYLKEGLKDVKKEQIDHYEKKYKVISSEKVDIEDLIIIENS